MDDIDFNDFFDGKFCFCGSRKLYIECHASKHYLHHREVEQDQIKFMQQRSVCLVSENQIRCKEPGIGSHSIQRKGVLSLLEENGHLSSLMLPRGKKKTVTGHDFSDISTKRASVFPGLCSRHDNAVFRPIENGPLVPSYRNSIRIAERETLYEAVTHGNAALFLTWLHSVPSFDFHMDTSSLMPDIENMQFYAGYIWELLDRIARVAKRKSPRKFYYLSILLKGVLPFSSSGCFCIEIDPLGNKLQKFSKPQFFNYAQISVFPQVNDTTLLTVSSLADHNRLVSRNFVKSFFSKSGAKIAGYFLYASLNYTEKVYYRPSYLKCLGQEQLNELVERGDDQHFREVGAEKPSDAISRLGTLTFENELLKYSTNTG